MSLKTLLFPTVDLFVTAHQSVVDDLLGQEVPVGTDSAALTPATPPTPGEREILLHGSPRHAPGLVLALAQRPWYTQSWEREDPQGFKRADRVATWWGLRGVIFSAILCAVIFGVFVPQRLSIGWVVLGAMVGVFSFAVIVGTNMESVLSGWTRAVVSKTSRPVRFALQGTVAPIITIERVTRTPDSEATAAEPDAVITAIYLPDQTVETWQDSIQMIEVMEELSAYHDLRTGRTHPGHLPPQLAQKAGRQKLTELLRTVDRV